MKTKINTEQAPAAIGPYSQAIQVANFLFVSGQLGVAPQSGDFVPGTTAHQTEQIFQNLLAILAASDMTLDDVVKTTVFLSDMADFAAMNEVYAQYFNEPYPARSTIAVKTLPKNALVEIEVIASSDTLALKD